MGHSGRSLETFETLWYSSPIGVTDLLDQFVWQLLSGEGRLSFEDIFDSRPEELEEVTQARLLGLLRGSSKYAQATRGIWEIVTEDTRVDPATLAIPPRSPAPAPKHQTPRSRPPSRTRAPARRSPVVDEETRFFEMDLRLRLRSARLVAEIGFDRKLHEKVCSSARVLLEGFDYDVDSMAQEYPAIFICHLVGHGVFDYAGGEFWSVPNSEGFDNDAGRLFLELIKRNGLAPLPAFDGQNAFRFVGRILLHGGIPEYCLEDFRELLIRGLDRHGSDAAELVSTWFRMKSAFSNVDKPIEHFLRFGEQFAVDYLDRCIDVVNDDNDEYFPSCGLPKYVFSALREGRRTERKKGVRTPSPTIRLDPYDFFGPTVSLPAVPVGLGSSRWRIESNGEFSSVATSDDQAREIPIPRAEAWDVSLLGSGGSVLSSRSFSGLPPDPDPPVLFFDASTEILLANQQSLPNREVLVLHAVTHDVAGSRFAEFSGEWQGFTATTVDLSDASEFIIGGKELPVERENRPELVGEVLKKATGLTGSDVYAAMPSLRLPPTESDQPWKIELLVNGQKQELSIGSLRVDGGGNLELPQPGGVAEVKLRVRGPLGSDLRSEFLFVRGLAIEAVDRIAVPGHPPVALKVSTSAGVLVNGSQIFSDSIEGGQGQSSIELEATDVAGAAATFRLHLPVLTWDWIGGSHAQASELSMSDLLDGSVAGLRGAVGRPGVHVALELAVDGDLVQVQEASSGKTSGAFSFTFAPFADTLRSLDASNIELRLRVGITGVRLAAIRPEFLVNDLRVDTTLTYASSTVHLSFEQNRPLEGRTARFWPLHRPWDSPVEFRLEDTGTTTTTMTFDAEELPAGLYRIELVLADWSIPRLPGGESENVADIPVGTRAQVHERLGFRPDRSVELIVEHFLMTGTFHEVLSDRQLDVLPGVGVPGLVALLRRGEFDRNQPIVDQLANLLAKRPAETFAELVRFIEKESLTHSERVRIELALLGKSIRPGVQDLPDELATSLWLHFPALAATYDHPACTTHSKLARFLDFSGVEDVNVTPSLPPVMQAWLGLDEVQMKEISMEAGIRGKPKVLSAAGLQMTHFEWLRAGADGDVDLAEWWRRHKAMVISGVAAPAVTARLHIRTPQGTQPHGSLPVASLQAAAHVIDRTDAARSAHLFLDALALFAPRLVELDLLVALLLTDS